MKIAVSSTGESLDAEIDPRFGRCDYFVLVDSETLKFEVIPNASRNASGGAGIKAAQFVAGTGVEALITGHLGPNADQALAATDIKLFTGISGTIRDAVEKYRAAELNETAPPPIEDQSGMKGGKCGPSGNNRGRGG